MNERNKRLNAVLDKIDEINAADPNAETVDGKAVPKEWVYGRRMSARLASFAPGASEALQIAARGQHIARWTIPRSEYPEGKQGYHQWRGRLAQFHAEKVGAIMADAGYGEDAAARVQSLIRKENLRSDPEAQCLEDVICLVFLEHYFAEFAQKHEEDKLIRILRKTWRKMSERGQAEALNIDMPEETRRIVEKALA